MAKAVGLSKGGTFKAVQCLHAQGHLEVEWGSPGRGHSNRYWWIIKVHSSDLSAEIKGHFSSVKGHPGELNPSITLVKGLEREPEARGLAPAQEKHFEKLSALWQRPWPDDPKAGQRAFEAACEVTSPEVILEAAAKWVAAADAPRYLPALVKWLNARSWEKDPPPKRNKTRNGGKADLAALAFAYGDYEPVEEAEPPDATIIELEAVTLLEWHTPTVVELFAEEAARWRDVP